MSTFILGLSTLLQLLAAGLAVRLIWVTRRRAAWLLIASAVALMALRRSITLSRILFSDAPASADTAAELVALLISILMVAGVALIAPYFREIVAAAAEAKESEMRLQAILENTTSIVYLKRIDGRYLLVNRKLEELLGVDWAGVRGKTDFDLFPRDVAEAFHKNDQAAAAAGCPQQFDEQALNRAGELRDYLSVKFPLRNADGEIYAVCGISTDITERLEAERHQQALEKKMLDTQKLESLGVLAGGIAHDFNNLLVPITAAADLLAERLGERDPATAKNLESIRAAADRAADLCRQLLAYSGRGQFRIEALDLSQQLRDTAQLLDLSAMGATLTYDLAEDLPLTEGDPVQLQQISMNLVVNAVEAATEGPAEITVRTGTVSMSPAELDSGYLVGPSPPAGDFVYLEVTDRGSGMDVESQRRLFEPFFTTKFTGRGLGLSAVLGIVRSHGGSIEVDSELGRGTRIRVLFPVHLPPVGVEPGVERASRTGTRRVETTGLGSSHPDASAGGCCGTILIVDDELSVREVTARVLEAAGFEVLLAENGRRGVEVYQEQSSLISAVLLDMTMPELNGEAAFRELRAIDPAVRVVLTSGYDEPAIGTTEGLLGTAAFVQKPYTAAELLSAIRSQVRIRRL